METTAHDESPAGWLEGAIAGVRKSGARKVFVQAPEGLKPRLQDIGSGLQKAGIEAVLSCEPCYGACDLRDAEAKRLGCELLLHIGHADFGLKPSLPVIYEEYRLDADVESMLGREAGRLDGHKSIGLVTTVQYAHLLDRAKLALESGGRKVLIGKPAAGGRARLPGQLLGCDQSAALSIEQEVDSFLCIGTGRFHAIGLASAVEKPVLLLDLETGMITELGPEADRFRRIKFANLEKARDCKSFGIVVSTKPGQGGLQAALRAKKALQAKGRDAWILAMDAISPEKLMGLKLDCLVNCSCPRLAEDSAQFRKPIIGPEDIDRL